MRIVAAISEDRKCVYTLEVSEPFLALAAHRIILENILSWRDILEKLGLATLRSTTSIGFRGEVAAMILCSMAWQTFLSENEFQFPTISADKFFGRLFAKPLDKLSAIEGPLPVKKRKVFNETEEEVENEGDGEGGIGGNVTWSEIASVLKQYRVRVNQTVKTYTHPTRAMLLENFIRSTAIACAENEVATDGIIPLAQCSHDEQPVTEKDMTAAVIDAKLRVKLLNEKDIQTWVERAMERLSFIPSKHPRILILLEFGPQTKTARAGEVTLRQIPHNQGFVFLCRRLSPADIFQHVEHGGDLQQAFLRLLESTVDPSKSRNIIVEHRKQVLSMFKGQPFGFGPILSK
jgi:hypothetical protein